MKTIKVGSIKELLDYVKEKNADNEYWFRGHADVDYILNPSAYRDLYEFADQFNRPIKPRKLKADLSEFNNSGTRIQLFDRDYLTTFFTELKKNHIKYDDSMNLIDKYCLAQHYGVWTPMMDWTTDFSVGIFFALDGRKEGKDCALFMLNPKRWNECTVGCNDIFTTEEAIHISNQFPLAVYGKRNDKRMCRQSGNFTVHGRQVWPLEKYFLEATGQEDILIKLIIPDKIAGKLDEYLKSFGITKNSIYINQDEKDAISKKSNELCKEIVRKKVAELQNQWENTPDKEKGVPRRNWELLLKDHKISPQINWKVYPNDPCPCGSGKKYKKCCGR